MKLMQQGLTRTSNQFDSTKGTLLVELNVDNQICVKYLNKGELTEYKHLFFLQ